MSEGTPTGMGGPNDPKAPSGELVEINNGEATPNSETPSEQSPAEPEASAVQNIELKKQELIARLDGLATKLNSLESAAAAERHPGIGKFVEAFKKNKVLRVISKIALGGAMVGLSAILPDQAGMYLAPFLEAAGLFLAFNGGIEAGQSDVFGRLGKIQGKMTAVRAGIETLTEANGEQPADALGKLEKYIANVKEIEEKILDEANNGEKKDRNNTLIRLFGAAGATMAILATLGISFGQQDYNLDGLRHTVIAKLGAVNFVKDNIQLFGQHATGVLHDVGPKLGEWADAMKAGVGFSAGLAAGGLYLKLSDMFRKKEKVPSSEETANVINNESEPVQPPPVEATPPEVIDNVIPPVEEPAKAEPVEAPIPEIVDETPPPAETVEEVAADSIAVPETSTENTEEYKETMYKIDRMVRDTGKFSRQRDKRLREIENELNELDKAPKFQENIERMALLEQEMNQFDKEITERRAEIDQYRELIPLRKEAVRRERKLKQLEKNIEVLEERLTITHVEDKQRALQTKINDKNRERDEAEAEWQEARTALREAYNKMKAKEKAAADIAVTPEVIGTTPEEANKSEDEVATVGEPLIAENDGGGEEEETVQENKTESLPNNDFSPKEVQDAAIDYLSYKDRDMDPVLLAEVNRMQEEKVRAGEFYPSQERYAQVLLRLQKEHGAGKVDQLANSLHGQCVGFLRNLNLKKMESYTTSKSWAYWDIAKQMYYFEQKKADAGYRIADPFEDAEKQQEIVNRHIGWEIFENGRGKNRLDTEVFKHILENSEHADEIIALMRKQPKENQDLASKDLARLGQLVREAEEKGNDKSKEPTGQTPDNENINQSETAKTEIRELTAEESQKIMERVALKPNIEYRGRSLTKETLVQNGLVPKYEMVLDGKRVWSSSKHFKYGNRTAGLAFFDSDDGKGVDVKPYVMSSSQGTFRFYPGFQVWYGGDDPIPQNEELTWFSKGYGEESLNLPPEMQKTIAESNIETVSVQNSGVAELILIGTSNKYLVPTAGQAGEMGGVDANVEKQRFAIDGIPSGHFSHLKLPPEQIDFQHRGQSPDFSKPVLGWKSKNSVYGEVINEVFDSKNKQLRFHFCRDAKNRAWIGSIEYTKSERNDIGLRKQWIDAGPLTTPAYEYYRGGNQLEDANHNDYANREDVNGEYADSFKNFLSKVPVIKEYLESVKTRQIS